MLVLLAMAVVMLEREVSAISGLGGRTSALTCSTNQEALKTANQHSLPS
jgi:hypothetical protein